MAIEPDKVSILLVDDQPAKLMSLEAVLADLGQNVLKASSADEALRLLLGNDIAVVLVDVCMPGMDGFALAELIRDHPRFRRTAIIFISAIALADSDRLKGYDLGAVDYIPVPVIPEVLRAKVGVFVELYRKTEQLQRLNRELEHRVAERTADLEASNAGFRDSERRYRQLLQGLPAAVYTCDTRGRIVLYNEAAAELWGRTPEVGKDEWCGSWRIYRPDGTPLPLDQCPMAITLREGRAVRGQEMIVERPDGTRRHVMPFPEPLRDASGNMTGAVNMLADITERKEAERARTLLSAIVASSTDAIVSKDLNGTITSWNAGAERMFGYTAGEILGRPILTIIPPDRHDEEREILARIGRGEAVEHFETVRLTKDARRLPVSIAVAALRDSSGHVIGASKVARDITENKAAQAQLEFQKYALDQAAIVAITDIRGTIIYVNDKFCTISGYSREELIGQNHRILNSGHHPREFFRRMYATISRGHVWRGEIRNRRKDGTFYWVDTTVVPSIGPDGRPERYVAVRTDITARKEAEESLRRHRDELDLLVKERTAELERSHVALRLAERMATIGTLSAGLGHDMGNLLMPVRWRLDAIETAELPVAVRDDLGAIRKATEYLQRLAASLRLLALDPEREPVEDGGTDLTDWWGEAEGMVRNALPRNVELEAAIPRSLPAVRIGKAGLTQVIFNLVQNAGDALVAGGIDDARVRLDAAQSNGSIRITVRDNGPGMSEDVRNRCVEPFFTTKTRALGTGLGLTLVDGIVNRAGGAVEIESQRGRGSIFTVVLPVASAVSQGPSVRESAAVTIADDRRRALVVSALQSISFSVRTDTEPGDASVWVTDTADAAARAVAERFISRDPARRVIVFGDWQSLPGVVCLEPDLRPSRIRERLCALLVRETLSGAAQ